MSTSTKTTSATDATAKTTAAKPAAKKATTKKATTTTTAAKKTTTTKKTTKKAATAIETKVAVQFSNKEVYTDSLLEQVKNDWVEKFEGKLEDIKTIELYIKPEEGKAYFVVNGLANGNYFINL